MNEVPVTTQYDVNLPKPRPRKVLLGVLVAVLVLGVIGVAAAVIANRAAQGPADPTARVMPADTMLYFSINTHTDKLPNFNVIADAWRDSKEAKQVAAALELAFTQAGLDWKEDVQPWLGDRVAVGLVDLGGPNPNTDQPAYPSYRTPFFLAAVQTKDRAKSDAALASLRKQLESKIKPNGYMTTTVGDETYRNIPLVYMTIAYGSFMGKTAAQPSDTLAYATVDDLVVATTSRAQLHQIVDAVLDGRNLATSENYKTVMGSLPNQNAGSLYMDYGRLMPAYFDMIMGFSTDMPSYVPCEFEAQSNNATPDAACVKQRQDEEQRRAEQQSKMQEQMQSMRDVLQAIGGMGAAMSYEPTGIRFDMAAQYDLSKLPEKWQKYVNPNQTPAPNRVFDSLPASTVFAANGNMQNVRWDMLLDPDYWAMSLSSLPEASRNEFTSKFAEFQKLIGIDLKADFLDLLNGEVAFAMLPKTDQAKSEFGFSLPFQFAVLFDSTDAAKASSSLDKIVQGASALMGQDGVKWQSLSGLPYSVVLDAGGKPMLTYGMVDGRFVIGTDSDTLLKIDNANQAPLTNDASFKQATGLLPGNRLDTFYLNFAPLWNLIETSYGDNNCQPCTYLKHFAWMSAGSAAPANGLELGSLHIGVSQ